MLFDYEQHPCPSNTHHQLPKVRIQLLPVKGYTFVHILLKDFPR